MYRERVSGLLKKTPWIHNIAIILIITMGACMATADANKPANHKEKTKGKPNKMFSLDDHREPGEPIRKIFSKPLTAPDSSPAQIQIRITQREVTLTPVEIVLDGDCPMMSSYVTKDETMFWKHGFNWHSLPIITRINLEVPTVFAFKNTGIKNEHFVVGVIREVDLKRQTNTPWKTAGVLCYQSCSKKEGSWMRHGELWQSPKRPVKRGQIMTVVIRSKRIEFWINKQMEDRADLPADMLRQPILPYVATFCSGDSFQLLKQHPLQPYHAPQ